MPIYTYHCDNCGIRFDQQQRFNEPPLVRCPECNKNALRKVYTPVGIVFKGSGFYSTDHRSPSGTSRSSSSSERDQPSSTSKPETAKTETATKSTSSGETP
ncbi:MAG: FmdB family zinc ribbon protein [Anaerolineales bacterium]|nr:zinc ribbon domain-containing protein [Anaerolineales bacterium]MCS7248600.1 zinc ribbon domain-containing protein [Anaerolineales bacterium]MDW8162413.1 FmdB family zinc ribbon protein [Anaerolineales bacterium]MDW8446551.1 FmdB family zinc ribbon protein [Anaerolineales bacterium]